MSIPCGADWMTCMHAIYIAGWPERIDIPLQITQLMTKIMGSRATSVYQCKIACMWHLESMIIEANLHAIGSYVHYMLLLTMLIIWCLDCLHLQYSITITILQYNYNTITIQLQFNYNYIACIYNILNSPKIQTSLSDVWIFLLNPWKLTQQCILHKKINETNIILLLYYVNY